MHLSAAMLAELKVMLANLNSRFIDPTQFTDLI
jgi:hypothetical protein